MLNKSQLLEKLESEFENTHPSWDFIKGLAKGIIKKYLYHVNTLHQTEFEFDVPIPSEHKRLVWDNMQECFGKLRSVSNKIGISIPTKLGIYERTGNWSTDFLRVVFKN